MGTRNLTIVKVDKKTKVAQYGQWDGYPTGQGQTIADFLKKVDLKKFKKQVRKLEEYTDNELLVIQEDKNWATNHPSLDRDHGADILRLINSDIITKVKLDEDFKEDTLFCEYYYIIDLDKETVSMNGGKQYTFKQWTRTGLMKKLEESKDE